MYDKNNIFAKIIRGELPTRKIYENQHAMSFYDMYPQAEIHVLIVPKGEYENILDFTTNASAQEQAGFWQAFVETAKILKVSDNFNAWMNAGLGCPFLSGERIMHFHLHLMAGRRRPDFNVDIFLR